MTKGTRSACAVAVVAAFMGTLGVQQASASPLTVATFADPSLGSPSMFQYDESTDILTGGWSGTGLTLETMIGDFTDVTFTLSPTAATLGGAGGAGVLEFFDDSMSSILQIGFGSSSLSVVGFSATEFLNTDDLTMIGPVVDIGFDPDLPDFESFSFAFSNQAPISNDGSFSATASFTSSAERFVIPEPASLTLLACAAGLVMRRRRHANSRSAAVRHGFSSGGLPSGRAGVLKLLVVVGGLFAFANQAQAVTLATFTDPAVDASTPLFEMDGNQLSGSWTGLTGLTLQTPGLSGTEYLDAQFSMAAITDNGDGTTGGGEVLFFDSGGLELFKITFDSGALIGPFGGFGATDFVANDVEITGAIVPFTLFDEAFSFAFANQVETQHDGFTATSSFTSSGVPEPASLALVAFGAAFALKRRRKSHG